MTFKDYIEENRGDNCQFCKEPTSIAQRNIQNAGMVCQCDWKEKLVEQYTTRKIIKELNGWIDGLNHNKKWMLAAAFERRVRELELEIK